MTQTKIFRTAAQQELRAVVPGRLARAVLTCDGCQDSWKVPRSRMRESANAHAAGCHQVPGATGFPASAREQIRAALRRL